MAASRVQRSGRLRLPGRRAVYFFLGAVVLFGAWEAASRLGITRQALLSSPTGIVTTAISDFRSGVLWPHIGTTLGAYVAGFIAAFAIGVPLAFIIGLSNRANALLSILVPALDSTPTVAIIPLIILIAGLGLETKIIVVVLAAVFPIIYILSSGVLAVERRFYDLARSFGASRWLTLRAVVFPSATPYLITAARVGAARALVGVITAEFLASNVGLGFFISISGATLDTARVWVGIILLGVFGVALGELIRRLERRFEVWRPAIR